MTRGLAPTLAFLGLLGFFSASFGACSKPFAQPAPTRCDPGVNVFCPCADLSPGTMECSRDGQSFNPCASIDSGEVCNMPGFAGASSGDGGLGGGGQGGFATASASGGGGQGGMASAAASGSGGQGGFATAGASGGGGPGGSMTTSPSSSGAGGAGGNGSGGAVSSAGAGGSPPATACPGAPIGLTLAADVTIAGDTTTAEDLYNGWCGGFGTPEIVYAVTPGDSGTLTATLTGIGATDAVLYAAIDGCDGGTPIGCSDAAGASGPETLALEAIAGRTIWLFADAATPGPFSLALHLDSSVPGDTCPGQPITVALGADVTTAGDTSIAAANYKGSDACAVSASTKDIVYAVTPEDDGTLTVTMTPTFDANLYARDGSCTTSTNQLGCSESGGIGAVETMSFAVTHGNKVSVFADGANGSAGRFTITFHLE
jgi:hypothetical protein